MAKIQCPKCSRVVPSDNVNVITDVALCPTCNEAFRVSESIDIGGMNDVALQNPPKGSWFRRESNGFTIGASTRSPFAFFIVPFMCVWSGGSLGGIYGSQITSGKFNLTESLFGIPFLLGSIVFWSVAMMSICGKVEVSVLGDDVTVFVGVGSFGWSRRCKWMNVKTIREEVARGMYFGNFGNYGAGIVLEGTSRLKFGTGLNEERRYFLLQGLRYLKGVSR
jgi:hypothetical protein